MVGAGQTDPAAQVVPDRVGLAAARDLVDRVVPVDRLRAADDRSDPIK